MIKACKKRKRTKTNRSFDFMRFLYLKMLSVSEFLYLKMLFVSKFLYLKNGEMKP